MLTELARDELDRDRVIAAIVRLLDRTGLRVGNDSYLRENHTSGLTTISKKHVHLHGREIELDFPGKGGKVWHGSVLAPRVARVVAECQGIPGYRLFKYRDAAGKAHAVGSAEINRWLHELTGNAELTAKDFRTWHACTLFIEAALERRQMARPATDESAAHAGRRGARQYPDDPEEELHPSESARSVARGQFRSRPHGSGSCARRYRAISPKPKRCSCAGCVPVTRRSERSRKIRRRFHLRHANMAHVSASCRCCSLTCDVGRRVSIFTLLSIAVAFLLYGLLAAVKNGFEANGNLAGVDRLVTMAKVSIVQPLPISYLQRIAAVPGVKLVTHSTWFGGHYQNERSIIITYPVPPESYLADVSGVPAAAGAEGTLAARSGRRRSSAGRLPTATAGKSAIASRCAPTSTRTPMAATSGTS